jgi:hypothetical protein
VTPRSDERVTVITGATQGGGNGNAAELATYAVEQGKPLLTLAE